MAGDRGDLGGRADDHHGEPPLPPSAGFPDIGTVNIYDRAGGRPWIATGIGPRIALLAPSGPSAVHRQRAVAVREAASPAARRAAPIEQAASRVRIVPGLAAQAASGAVHAIEGITLPVRTRDGIRFGVYLAPIDAPVPELMYHEAVHLHAAEGRGDGVVTALFEGVGFDEFDRAEGIGRYRTARRAEERLATAAGRILGADDHLPWPGAGAGSAALRTAGNLHGAGHEASRDAEGRRADHRRLFHPSLTHPLFLQFLEELRTGALGQRPSDPVAREAAIRRLGFTGYDDPRLQDLPRYSLGARGSLAAVRRATASRRAAGDNDGIASPAREVPMDTEAAVYLPADIQGRLPREPLPLGDPGVRAALRPVLDSWWRQQREEVRGADRAIDSPDALLTDPSVAASAELARLRNGLLSTIGDATGAHEILISDARWKIPVEPPYRIHGLPALPGRSDEGVGSPGDWLPVGTYANAAQTRGALSDLAAAGTYARLVVQAGSGVDWRPDRAAWAVSFSRKSRDAPAEDFAALIGAVRGSGLSLPATTLEMDLSVTPTGEPAALAVTFQLASEQSARDFARTVARLGPWLSEDAPRRLPPPATSATHWAGELAKLGALAALAAAGMSEAPDDPDLMRQDAAAIIDRLATWDLPPDAGTFAERLPTPELAEAGARLATELGWIARRLQDADLPTSPEIAGVLERIATAAQASGGAPLGLPDLPDPASLKQALAALPADTALAARETLANYVDALTQAYDALEVLEPGATQLRRSTLQGYGLDAGLPVISDPSAWPVPPLAPEAPYPEIPYDFSALDPAASATIAGDSALVERLQGLIRLGVDEAARMEIAVQDMLPEIQARLPAEQDAAQHLARLIQTAEGTVGAAPKAGDALLQTFGHHVSELAAGAVAKAVNLAEPIGAMIHHAAIHHAADLAEATARLGQGVLYSTRETGPAAGIESRTKPAASADLGDAAGVPALGHDKQPLRHAAPRLDEMARRSGRRSATGDLDRALSVTPPGLRETLLLAFGRLTGDPAAVAKGDDPALLALRRHAVQTALGDLAAGLSSGLTVGTAIHDRSEGARDRRILERAEKVLADAIPRAERQQARRDLMAVAGQAGLAIERLRPTMAGFLHDADPRLAKAIAEGVAERRPAALRLAARNAGLPGPYWVVRDSSAATTLAAAVDGLVRDPTMAQQLAGADGNLPIDRTRSLLAGGEPGGTPPGVLPPAEARTGLAAAALALAGQASRDLLPAVAAIAPARPWAPWTPPAAMRPVAPEPTAGIQR